MLHCFCKILILFRLIIVRCIFDYRLLMDFSMLYNIITWYKIDQL